MSTVTMGNSAAILVASTLLALLAVVSINRYHDREQIKQLIRQVSELQSQTESILHNGDDQSEAGAPSALGGRELEGTSSCNCTPDGQTYASNFGVVGDADADDGPALQAAIDSAASNESGGTVILGPGTFRIDAPLIVPGGVTLLGQGYGSSPLAVQLDAGASTIAYCGTDHAVKLTGHAASLRDLAVYDWPYTGCENIKAAGGVLVEADQTLLESVFVSSVLIYYFVGGTALSLVAKNNGGVFYGDYQNVRIRHAKTGIHLSAEDGSVVNGNSFLGGVISGGGFESGIYAEGPGPCNHNKFYGQCIGAPDSDIAHVYVTGSMTNVKMHDARLEATDKSLDKPIVIIDDSSYGNVMNGILGHTHIQANLNRNPEIDFMSQKSIGLDPAPVNQYWNAAFKGWDGANRIMPGWAINQANTDITVLDDSEALFPDHRVISLDYKNWGGAFKLKSDDVGDAPGHDFVTFGVYARSSVQGSISAVMRYASGSIISSGSHSGSGEWEFIGMSALYDKTAPYFYFSVTGDVDLTAPSLTFGQTPATPGASLMSSSGARMSGTLTTGVAIGLPPSSGNFWTLPKNEGNVFLMDMQGDPDRYIDRLNQPTADRFSQGTVITLMFSEAGTTVRSSVYIELTERDFVSTPQSSLTLMADTGGTWIEVSRNEHHRTVTAGVATGLPPSDGGYYWTLPTDEGNVFLMDMQGDPSCQIKRLNQPTADRFPQGTVITLMFTEAGTIIESSGYIELTDDKDFVSTPHSSLILMADTGGTWIEVSRNEHHRTLTAGVATGLPPPEGDYPYYWTLPTNEGNVFLMDMQGDPNRHIKRINQPTAVRFPHGTVITLMFTEAGTRVWSSGYIKLKDNADFVSKAYSSLTLMATGGSMMEVSRNE